MGFEPLENPYWEKGQLVAGLDEAGRGPLAGPVVVACVVLKPFTRPFLTSDSKKYSPAKREELFEKIIENALGVTVSFATVESIEEKNVYRATQRAFENALSLLPVKVSAVFTDYMPLKGLSIPCHPLPKGDARVFSIAAASIVAKVIRDRLMVAYSKQYPQYGFEKHKGYPTKEHLKALKTYGVSPIHRKNYSPIKEILNQKRNKNLF